MMGFSVVFPANELLAATPASLVTNVTVDGIEEGGVIDTAQSIELTVKFDVPVQGDGEDDFFAYNDDITLVLSEAFRFAPVPTDPIVLKYQSKTLGTVTLSNNENNQAVASIVFDGDEDVFDPDKIEDGAPYSGVSGEFEATLHYNNTYNDDGSGNRTVRILDKEYTLLLPGDTVTYGMEKSVEDGDVDLDAGTVTWTVVVTAEKDTQPDPTPVDLAGYVFEDDLSNVGEYISGSFSLTEGELKTPDEGSPTLAYTFPDNSVSPQTLKFQTKISADVMTEGGRIENKAKLTYEDEEITISNLCYADVEAPTVTKTGETTDDSSGEKYDPNKREITWYITVDNVGRTLKNLTITDELKDGQTFDSAIWQKKSETGDEWEDTTPAWQSVPSDNAYSIGDVDYVGRLKIVTRVPSKRASESATTPFPNAVRKHPRKQQNMK